MNMIIAYLWLIINKSLPSPNQVSKAVTGCYLDFFQRSTLTKKSTQKILTKKSLALEWQI